MWNQLSGMWTNCVECVDRVNWLEMYALCELRLPHGLRGYELL